MAYALIPECWSSPLSMGDTFQDSQWMCETAESTESHMYTYDKI